MNAGTLSLKKIFGQDRRHVVPLFQRPYVWKKDEQLAPFWEDVRTLAERILAGQEVRPHFMGAVVLDLAPLRYGEVETRVIIDGQQRLTTIQILLEAFCDITKLVGQERVNKALLKLTRNDDPMSDDPEAVYKVWPTNEDREAFRRVMDMATPEEVRRAYGASPGKAGVGNKIADCYLFFHSQVKAWLDDGKDKDQRAEALLEALREYVRMVVIDLDREDDAQLIFETLNARGSPLTPSDLVKNFLFHQAAVENPKVRLEDLYHKHWQAFEAEARYWREKVGRGHAQRERLDTFLSHYLTLQERDEVPAAQLYAAFRSYAVKHAATRAEEHLASLQRYAGIYRTFDRFAAGSPEGLFFERLRQFDISTAMPFLLELFARHGEERDVVRSVLRDIESLLVRRMVCQLSTRTYGRFFAELTGVFDAAGETATLVRSALLASEAESARWPDDAEFREAWMTAPLFRVHSQAKIRTLLEALERGLPTRFSENVVFNEKLTIEHILPQAWRPNWPLPEGGDAAHRDRILHTIGNLTLVSGRLNPSLSNSPWSEKRQALDKHGRLMLNRELIREENWGEVEIEARGRKLFEEACRLWPHPGRAKESGHV